MKKRFSVLHLLLAVLVTAAVSLGGAAVWVWSTLGSEGLAVVQGWLLSQTMFVGECSAEAASEGALDGLVTALGDRWTHYLNPQEFAQQTQTRSNSYVGVGITVDLTGTDGIRILAVEPEGPAAQAGLRPGEIITAVDGVSAAGEGLQTARDSIAGEAGTQVELTVRAGDGSSRTVTVTRAVVQVHSVTSRLLDGEVGLVTIRNFYSGTADAFQKEVEDLLDQGAGALVLDVRNNPGGYVTELTAMLDFLLPEGDIFRSTTWQGRESVTTSDESCVQLPIAVLVNGDSYSAAEFFAAQLREAGWAVVVGLPTCGKGFSQQTMELQNGGALLLSTAKYATGGGVSLVDTGVTLDREVELFQEKAALLASGLLEPEEDDQLQAAVELLQR